MIQDGRDAVETGVFALTQVSGTRLEANPNRSLGARQCADAHSLENAIIVASLAHQCARTPAERRQAWERLQALIAQHNKSKG